MKKFFVLLMALVVSISINAQNRLDDNGQKTGKWSKTYDNGKLKYKGQFEEGHEVGKFIFFFPTGKKKSIMTFSEKGKKAAVITYYKNGKQQSTGSYFDKKKDGVWKYYNQTDGAIVKQEGYKKGAKDGVWIVFYSGKGKATEVIWKDGKRNGIWKEYFENGKVKLSAEFSDDKMVGEYTDYASNGKVSKKGLYVDGKQDGKWISYNDNGGFNNVTIYKMGQIRNEKRYEDGKLILEIDKVNHKVTDYRKKSDGGEE